VDTTQEVPKDFWDEYSASAGVYTVGEIFNGNYAYVAGYQGHLDATLNYPGFWMLRSVFEGGNSMYQIRGISLLPRILIEI
jgi:alpha-amylase